MRLAHAQLESASPYSPGRYHDIPRDKSEDNIAYEERTWRERMHVTDDGVVFIPPMAFKNSLSEAARFLGARIPGRGKMTFAKHFDAGVIVPEGIVLPIRQDEAQGEWLFVPSDGRRGGTSRIKKCFPKIPRWSGTVTFVILDDAIPKDVFEEHLDSAGKFIGIGRFRPSRNGYYGRFAVRGVEWSDGDA